MATPKPVSGARSAPVCNAYTMEMFVFDWDKNNLEKIRAHRIKRAEAEGRYVYYGETTRNRMLAVVLTERDEKIRVITAYDLDAGQKRDYLERRALGDRSSCTIT